MPDIGMVAVLRITRSHGQTSPHPLECLDAGLLVGAEDDVALARPFKGGEIGARHVPHAGVEVWVGTPEPHSTLVRLEVCVLKPTQHSGRMDRLGNARFDCQPSEIRRTPVRDRHAMITRRFDRPLKNQCLLLGRERRRPARPRSITQALETVPRVTPAPASDGVGPDTQFGRDLGVGLAFCGAQDDSRSFDVSLTGRPRGYDPYKLVPFLGRQGNGRGYSSTTRHCPFG